MKVLHVLPSIDPKLGGAVEFVRQSSAVVSRQGARSEVLVLEVPSQHLLESWTAKVHWLRQSFGKYRYAPGLVSWMDEHHSAYDAVVVHGVWQHQSVGVWRALRDKATPYFLFTHGMLDPWFAGAYPLKHIKKSVYWRLFERRVLRDARAVLFTSEAERRLASQSFRPYRCQEGVVGMGTAEPPGEAASQRHVFLSAFPHLRGRRIVLFLSRIHKKKGLDLLIRAFQSVAGVDPLFHLVIAGSDEEGARPELEQLATRCGVRERMTWTGHLDGDLKWGAFRAAEVFALPSHSENYGNAVVEAMACGLPVLITNKVNIWREISDGGAGLVANDDVEGAIGLFKDWSQLTTSQRKTLGANALRCYRNRFELHGFARRFVDFLRDAVADTRGERRGVSA